MSTGSILVVEDNLDNSKLIQVLLRSHGYDVRTAADAEEALQIMKTFVPELILMDLHLPGMDGLELTQRLKQDPSTQGIFVVALAAFAMKGGQEKALAGGCDGYVSKPIDVDTFPKLVASWIESRRRTRAP